MFSMAEYETFVSSVADEEAQFKARQAEGVRRESERCGVLENLTTNSTLTVCKIAERSSYLMNGE